MAIVATLSRQMRYVPDQRKVARGLSAHGSAIRRYYGGFVRDVLSVRTMTNPTLEECQTVTPRCGGRICHGDLPEVQQCSKTRTALRLLWLVGLGGKLPT